MWTCRVRTATSIMSRRHIANVDTANLPPESARKKAKAAQSRLSTSWLALLNSSIDLFEFLGDLTSEETIAEMCASTIVSLTGASNVTLSLQEKFGLAQTIWQNTSWNIMEHLLPTENDQAKNERWTKARELVTVQVNAAFAVCEESLIELAANGNPETEDYGFCVKTYGRMIGILQDDVLFLVDLDKEAGWSYFDTISLRFFTNVVIVTADKFPAALTPAMKGLFNNGAENPPFGQYLRRDNIASAACVTLLVDWLWSSLSQTASAYCAAEMTGSQVTDAQHFFWGDIMTVLRHLTFATMDPRDGNRSPLVSSLIARAQHTLSAVLNPSTSTPATTSVTPPAVSLNVSIRPPLEFIYKIQCRRNEEMTRLERAHLDADEMAITVPLILQVINTSPCSRQNRHLAFECFKAFTSPKLARDEIVRLGYLKPLLDTVVPFLLGQKRLDFDHSGLAHELTQHQVSIYDVSVRSAFNSLVGNAPTEKSFIWLDDFPREYADIDSPTNLLCAIFHFVQLEVTKSKSAQMTTESAQAMNQQTEYINSLAAWYDAIVRAQVEESRAFDYVDDSRSELDEEAKAVRKKVCNEYWARCDANRAAGKSTYMTMVLIREVYNYFIELVDKRTAGISFSLEHEITSQQPQPQSQYQPQQQQQQLEGLYSFEMRTASVLLCARLLTDPIASSEFMEEKMMQLSDRIIGDLMHQTSSTLSLDATSLSPISLPISIFRCHTEMHTSLGLLARYEYARQPAFIAAQVDLLLRVIDSQYGSSEMDWLNTVIQPNAEHAKQVCLSIDNERVAALACFGHMLNCWPEEELSDIPFRVFKAIRANHWSYLVTSQRQAIEVVSLLLMVCPDLLPDASDNVRPVRGVDCVLSDDLIEFVMSARQFLFDLVLHTPNRSVANIAFKVFSMMMQYYGQASITRGEVTLPSSISVPALTAYQLVCRMFLSCGLPCQNTALRRECGPQEISYMTDDQLPPQTLKMIESENMIATTITSGQQQDQEIKNDEDEENPCRDDQDEKRSDNGDLMTSFMTTIHVAAHHLPSQQFLSSIFVPILPALRQFHLRSWDHELACAILIDNLHRELGQEMAVHFDEAIMFLASYFMSLHDLGYLTVIGPLQQTAREILAAAQPQLDLKKILPDAEVREHFEKMVAITPSSAQAEAQ